MTRKGFDRIAGNLYQGGHRSLPRASSFDVLVLCAVELQPGTSQLNLAMGGEPPATVVLACPMDDCDPMRGEDAERALAASVRVAEYLRHGRSVLVTCYAGHNRSGLVSALTLMRLGMTGAAAVREVQQRRPGSLSNHAFVEFIRT